MRAIQQDANYGYEAVTTTTIAVEVDDNLKLRLRLAATKIDRTPEWLVTHALITEVERIERHKGSASGPIDAESANNNGNSIEDRTLPHPFLEFAQSVQPESVHRAKITAAYRRSETDCLRQLISAATLPLTQAQSASDRARELVVALRRKKINGGTGVEALIQEYSLSSHEGVALMCLAEALLRIPDHPTRDALIRDKISSGAWQAHVGRSRSVFVNAATWGLVVTGKLTATSSEVGLSAALSRLIGRGGEPLIRKGVDIAMRMMGEQFVTGQTIGEALANSRRMQSKGFLYSYDMLGEAAATNADAQRYFQDYEQAVHAIGNAANHRGIYESPGISVKLSALHPRYCRAQRDRVFNELLPRVKRLALSARRYDIGLNIDAEENDRLDLSLDILEKLSFDPDLAGWNGIGFAVQAYQKRAFYVIEWAIDLARRAGRRLMIRLVKGAYWDTEIKRAQVDGLEDFPVFTRKVHTDVSYLACGKTLLSAPDAAYPQFATHNAQTVAAIVEMAGANYYAGQYEFQCLHGMGEPLYEEIVGKGKLNRPCRIYAPVGTHETLLAYLVRRLLENGANSSFVNRIADAAVSVEDLIRDPVAAAQEFVPLGLPHTKILHPRAIFGDQRLNSAGLDLSNEQCLASLSASLLVGSEQVYVAKPVVGNAERDGAPVKVSNPADPRDLVGLVTTATTQDVHDACMQATAAASFWGATPVHDRAAILMHAAHLLENRMLTLMGLICREAGKTLPNALAEVREAVDFLRYYAVQAQSTLPGRQRSLGAVLCISPWNFPLAIFTGQVAAALAAGNTVIAKPAEETPLIAAAMVRIFREAGVPTGALQLLPGDGSVGAAAVKDPRISGVMFTGSTEVARSIQRELAKRLTADGFPIPLIAETGGQNAMIVDSSALAEQVVYDVITSAFDSAGQRCSALRILCLQEDVADRMLEMLKGAMQELVVGVPDQLNVDIGPIISQHAKESILAHVGSLRAKGRAVYDIASPIAQAHGNFVSPTLIEIEDVNEIKREVFGPILHVLRYRRDDLGALIDSINATGYGLTFGLHTRLDETIAFVSGRVRAGNVYINRNMVGAVVGVQPFGGQYLSGTGPKAGGPLYLGRLVSRGFEPSIASAKPSVEFAVLYLAFLQARSCEASAERVSQFIQASTVGSLFELSGPVGERNDYQLRPRGDIAALAQTQFGLLVQIGAILASGNHAIIPQEHPAATLFDHLPKELESAIFVADWRERPGVCGVLFEGDADELLLVCQAAAALEGPIVVVQGASVSGLLTAADEYSLHLLMHEVSISTNISAAGGNASLMAIG